MATEKFVYTVSGVELSDAQKEKISREIAAAVTRVVLGEEPRQIQPQLVTLHGVYGGKLANFEAQGFRADFVSTGCQ
jgi:hypothetical protein